MHSGEPDPIFLAPRRPRKGPEKLVRKWVVSYASSQEVPIRTRQLQPQEDAPLIVHFRAVLCPTLASTTKSNGRRRTHDGHQRHARLHTRQRGNSHAHSERVPFDPQRHPGEHDLSAILEAARWAPTAHNMQNFEIIVDDDKATLAAIGRVRGRTSEDFIRENYAQPSFSEEELIRKGTGLLATMFPPSWRDPIAGSREQRMSSTGSWTRRCARARW